MHGISGSHIPKTGDKWPEGSNHRKADPIQEKVFFHYYRLAKGIAGILSYAKEGIRLWFKTKRPVYRQFCLKLTS